MKYTTIFLVNLGLLASVASAGTEPASAPNTSRTGASQAGAIQEDTVDPIALGNVDAVVSFCREISPDQSAGYDKLRNAVIGTTADKTVAALKETNDYREAYAEARKNAQAQAHDVALKDCGKLAAPRAVAVRPVAPAKSRVPAQKYRNAKKVTQ